MRKGGGGEGLCVEMGFEWTFLENEIKSFYHILVFFYAIVDSMSICFTGIFLSTQIFTKEVNFTI